MTSQSNNDPSGTAGLGRLLLLLLGAGGGFFLGGETMMAIAKWQSPVLGGESLMGAAYGALFIGGPVGALVGSVLSWVAGRRMQSRFNGWVVLGLFAALLGLTWWAAGVTGFR